MAKKTGNRVDIIQDDELNDFMIYLTDVIGYSQKTALSYGSDIGDFLLFLKNSNIEKKNVDKDLIRQYLMDLRIRGLQAVSVKRYLSSNKHFYKYLHQYKNYPTNPFETIHAPKKKQKLPKFLTEKEINSFLDANATRKDRLALRDQAILELMYASGLRCSEVIGLKIQDVDLSRKEVKVFGKGGKERIVPFNESSKAAIEAYLEKLRGQLVDNTKNDEKILFLNSRGEKLTERGLENIVQESSLKCGFGQKVHPHMIRHTFATTLLNNGADLRIIQELLGHESISTTAIYTHVTYEDLKRTYQACFPKAKTSFTGKPNEDKAVIFDFNGTMFFDDDKHVISWKAFAKQKYGYDLKDEEFPGHIHGHNNADILHYLTGKTFTPEETLMAATEKELMYQKICEDDNENLHLVKGLSEFLDLLVKNHIKIGIATASMKPNVDWYIKTFHLSKWFDTDHIVYDDNTLTRGKPDPMIYHRAMQILNVLPENVLVFEDSPSGIESAYRADVGYIVAIRKPDGKDTSHLNGVKTMIEDFSTLPKEVLEFLKIRN